MGPYEFTTIDAVKRYKWPQGDRGGADTALADLITRVTAEIQDHLHRKLYQDTWTELRNGAGGDIFQVAERPIASVTTLHDSVDGTFDPTTLVDPADYAIDKRAGIIRKRWVPFLCGEQNLQLVYVGGWPNIPPAVESVAIERVLTYYELRDALATSSISHGDGSRTYMRGTEFTKSQIERLQPFRNLEAY